MSIDKIKYFGPYIRHYKDDDDVILEMYNFYQEINSDLDWNINFDTNNQTYLGHAILLLSAPIYQLTRHIMSQSCSPPILGEIDLCMFW